ncbi:C2 domain protein [Ancylostoma duodenale]|uniref:C2 domain protein n=1 Tax=Ancylostoma duodenale TaxID=51022 RepID=A0A0C2G971_9BILA|nr:C2 domain protein [Ancylostoma duodenale]
MYSLFSSCLLQCCPHGGVLFFEPTRSYQYEGYVGAESTKPRLRVAAQYSEQKKAIIVKVISVHCCDLFVDDVSQVRLYFGDSRAKQQTSVVRGEEPTFNQTFTFTNVEKAELLSTPIRFRICSRSGKSRMNLRAEGQLEGLSLIQFTDYSCNVASLKPLAQTIRGKTLKEGLTCNPQPPLE